MHPFRSVRELLCAIDTLPEVAIRGLGQVASDAPAGPSCSGGAPRSGGGPESEGRGLYVPVTRKVSLTDETPGGTVTQIGVTPEDRYQVKNQRVAPAIEPGECAECGSPLLTTGTCLMCDIGGSWVE